MFAWEKRTIKVKAIQQPYDIGIVLGGYSKSTKQLLNDNRLLALNSSANRLTQAIELYKLGKKKHPRKCAFQQSNITNRNTRKRLKFTINHLRLSHVPCGEML